MVPVAQKVQPIEHPICDETQSVARAFERNGAPASLSLAPFQSFPAPSRLPPSR